MKMAWSRLAMDADTRLKICAMLNTDVGGCMYERRRRGVKGEGMYGISLIVRSIAVYSSITLEVIRCQLSWWASAVFHQTS